MKIFKVIGNTFASIGNTVQNSAELVNMFVGDEGLKHSTRQSFKIINTALDESVEMALLESQEKRELEINWTDKIKDRVYQTGVYPEINLLNKEVIMQMASPPGSPPGYE